MRNILSLLTTLLLVNVFTFALAEESSFSSTTIDIGVVVSDIDAAVKFYTEAVGFSDAGGFSVAGDFAKNAGLTNGAGLNIRVLKLGEGESATKLKLMQVEGVEPKKSDNTHIHSQTGFSYITLHVTDTDAAMARLKKAGVKPVAQGPVAIPKTETMYLTVVKDPDGNFVELLGPGK